MRKGFTKVVTTSTETICDYKRYCRDICFQVLQENSNDQIGGPDLHDEIDESKFDKTKYNGKSSQRTVGFQRYLP